MDQFAFRSWLINMTAIFEGIGGCRSQVRRALKHMVPDAILPGNPVLGDLYKVRNNLLNNNRATSAEKTGKCETLKWIRGDDKVTIGLKHILNLLDQLSLYDKVSWKVEPSRVASIGWIHDKILAWQPTRRVIIARANSIPNIKTGELHRGLHINYDNGYRIEADLGPREAFEDVELQDDGSTVVMPSLGTRIDTASCYLDVARIQRDGTTPKLNRLGGHSGQW